MSNLRLFLMTLACGIAALTHFNGQPFPENRGIILAAILGYSAISAALQLMSWFIDGSTLINTHPAKVSSRSAYSLRNDDYVQFSGNTVR